MPFEDWCDEDEQILGDHEICILTARATELRIGRNAIAAVVPTHYASEERISELLVRLGKPGAATFIRNKLPEGPKIRSGDLGEILATEYVSEQTEFEVPIKRLRWKDHREMAMRGDDLIGFRLPIAREPIKFLKCETKSRANLRTLVLEEARDALDNNRGLPSPHALSYVADRTREAGDVNLANQIDEAQFRDGIKRRQVRHMLFVFCGSNPRNLLQTSLRHYGGRIDQIYVGLQVERHQRFIKRVYAKVISDADNS